MITRRYARLVLLVLCPMLFLALMVMPLTRTTFAIEALSPTSAAEVSSTADIAGLPHPHRPPR